MSTVITDELRGALLWLLWHHQGGSSPVGQPIREMLGMGQHDRLTNEQVAEAKASANGRIYAGSIPVMGEPVAYTYQHEIDYGAMYPGVGAGGVGAWHSCKTPEAPGTAIYLYLAPSTAITQEELDGLRKDAARFQTTLKIMFDDWHPVSVAYNKLPGGNTPEEMIAAIDRAMQDSQK